MKSHRLAQLPCGTCISLILKRVGNGVRSRNCLFLALLFFSFQLAGSAAKAQSAVRILGKIDDARVVRIEHSTHPLARPANEAGRIESNKNLERMILVLSPSPEQEEDLKQFLEDVQNCRSASYHRWLTPAEYGARFGLADADVEKVQGWLEQNGLTVGPVAKGERWIEFSGTAGQVENAFHTELHYYQVGTNLHLAHATDLALPEKLAAVLRGVASLNNFGKRPPRKMIRGVVGRDAQGRKVQLQHNLTAVGTTNTYYLAPGDFAAMPRPVFPRKPFPARVHL